MSAIAPAASLRCRLCGRTPLSTTSLPNSPDRMVTCRVCGEYEIEGRTWHAYAQMDTDPEDRHLLSALTRTGPFRGVGRVRIESDSFVALKEGRIRIRTFIERRDSVLDWLAWESRKSPKSAYGAKVPLNTETDYPVAFCQRPDGDWSEWNYIVQPLLGGGLIHSPENGMVAITPTGWERIEARPRATGTRGFVAMSFAKELAPVYQAIAKGITAAGYEPMRIDADHYIGGVMDRIVSKIRESRFVVADLTQNRGGVYYEAGFALGRDIPVFLLCRRQDLAGDVRVHFDVQHLFILAWDEDGLPKLSEDLEAKITAVLGRGPLSPTA